jgi:small-conductance mechanosensitive channel
MVNWREAAVEGLQNFWEGFINFIPSLIIALIVFLIGWFISSAIGRVIGEVLKRLKFDKFFEARGWQEAMDRAEIKTTVSEFIGGLCKWILIIVFLAISVEILGLPQFSAFLQKVIAWLPNLLIAVLMFVATVVIANFAEKMVKAGVGKAKVGYSDLAGSIVRWSIWVFGLFAILLQLGIAESLILVLFQGFVALVAIAGGLAFGFGGKDLAAEILSSLREKIRK